MTSLFTVLLFLFISSHAAKLPDFIVPCKDGPTLNDCAVEAGNHVIEALSKDGLKQKLPSFDPLLIQELSMTENAAKSMSFNMTLTGMELHGLKNAKFVKSEMDTQAKHFVWHFELPKVHIKSHYKISGKILLLPIFGEGPMEADIENPKFTLSLNYELVEKDGEAYPKITKVDLNYALDSLHIKLENLFNGDKALGESMNIALNENWKEVNHQMGRGVSEALGIVGKQLMEAIIKDVPFNHIIES